MINSKMNKTINLLHWGSKPKQAVMLTEMHVQNIKGKQRKREREKENGRSSERGML